MVDGVTRSRFALLDGDTDIDVEDLETALQGASIDRGAALLLLASHSDAFELAAKRYLAALVGPVPPERVNRALLAKAPPGGVLAQYYVCSDVVRLQDALNALACPTPVSGVFTSRTRSRAAGVSGTGGVRANRGPR